MSDTILTDEEGTHYSYDNLRTQGWLDGHAEGLEAAVAWLRERAVVLFRDGKDTAAIQLRDLANTMRGELLPHMVENAQRHAREFPILVVKEDE